MLVVSDALGLTLAFVVTEAVSIGVRPGQATRLQEILVFIAVIPVWVLAAKLYGLYDRDEDRADHSTADELAGLFNAISVGAWVIVAVALTTELIEINLPKILVFWGLAIVLVCTARAVARAVCRRLPAYVQRTVIVGTGPVARRLARQIRDHPEYGLDLVGFVDVAPAEDDQLPNGIPVLGTPPDLAGIVERVGVDRVIFGFSNETHDVLLSAVRACRDLPARVDVVPRFFDVMGASTTVHRLGGTALVGLRPAGLPRSSQLLKRAVDVLVSSVSLIVLAPALAAIAIAIKVDSSGPILFSQLRMGAGEHPFRMHKFRTMVVGADALKPELGHLNQYAANGGDPRMFKAQDDPRTTRLGRVLRRFSLDELPQLVNVLSGDMSMVGPRPLVLDEDRHIADWGRRRLDLKPGITGPWQVLGRNAIPLDEMVGMDYLYVTNWSLMQDLALMLRTIPAVVRPRSVY